MSNKEKMSEELLETWLRSVTTIRGNRLLSGMSFNEIAILRMIYKAEQAGETLPTAAEICRELKILKSQAARILAEMEKKNMIIRLTSARDKRKVMIGMTAEQRYAYLAEHKKISVIFEHLLETFDERELISAMKVLNAASDYAEKLMEG